MSRCFSSEGDFNYWQLIPITFQVQHWYRAQEMSIQSCLVPSTFAVAAIINPRYLWSRSHGQRDDFAGHNHHPHCILFRQKWKDKAFAVSRSALLHVVPVLLDFPLFAAGSSKLLVPPAWPDVKEAPAWAQKWHCSFSAELPELLIPHSFQCFLVSFGAPDQLFSTHSLQGCHWAGIGTVPSCPMSVCSKPSWTLVDTGPANSSWTQWPQQSIPEGHCEFVPTISEDILRTEVHQNSSAQSLGEEEDPHSAGTACALFCWSSHCRSGRGWEQNWNNIFLCSEGGERGVIHSDMHPSRACLHILTGCGCSFRSVLSSDIKW